MKVAWYERQGRACDVPVVGNMHAPLPVSLHLIGQLARRDLTYMHLSEPDGTGGKPLTEDYRRAIRAAYPGVIVGAGAYTRDKANAMLDKGYVDAVAFGHPFIAHPDLVRRFALDAPLNEPDKDTFYGGGHPSWERMVDVNHKGVLHGIAAALRVFRRQGFGLVVNIVSTAGLLIVPTMALYTGSKNAVRAISEGLRQEAGDKLRVTPVSPDYVKTELPLSLHSASAREDGFAAMEKIAIPPDAIAQAIAFAIGQPSSIDVGEIVVRPTAQS